MTRSFTDQMQRKISVPFPPKRIVSLVPSQTELLCYIGLEKELLGLTKFCIHPESARRSSLIIGGTKQLHLDKIASLQPDLIIGNKEENQQEQIEVLMKDVPVWMSDIYTLEDALDMIRSIGQVTDREAPALSLSQSIESAFSLLSEKKWSLKKAAYLIWRKPYMVAARGTFIDDMLTKTGFVNAFANDNRYPEKTAAQLNEAQPEVLLLSSEPYPFKEKHLAELQQICPNAVIKLVDGELFSWYGSRLLHSASYFANLRSQI